MRQWLLALFLPLLPACASVPAGAPTDIADLEPGTYALTATLPVRDDTEFQERSETLVVEAQLSVDGSGGLEMVADTGPCVETDPSIDLRRSPLERRFECGESTYVIQAARGLPEGTVVRFVNNFVRRHTGCRRVVRQNERDVCVEDAYTVVHSRVRKTSDLRARLVSRGS